MQFQMTPQLISLEWYPNRRLVRVKCENDDTNFTINLRMKSMVSCKMRGAGCGKVSTRKMRGKVQGITPQFIHMNTPLSLIHI